tara:strand:- start:1233 stop:2861 length:1629 start_codon:yes stop_codon:yes gene_type:complete
MTQVQQFQRQTKALIDDLKAVSGEYGLGNDGNEFKIITQVFLYKFLNDKFIYEVKKLDADIASADNVEEALKAYNDDDYEMLTMQLSESTAQISPDQLISSLFSRQNEPNFADIFDTTLLDIARINSGIFSAVTDGGEKIALFENISKYVIEGKDDFCKAVINKLVSFSFEHIFDQKFDFYAGIFEYLIKDYNSNSGGTYAEYFTPHAVAKIMARCLVSGEVDNATCFDPSAGSGTLLMNLAHVIGEDKCSIYSQDISQKSSSLLRLNLILNGLVHSIPNIVKGNTIKDPYHTKSDGQLQKFDYIVANPPFKLNFSGYRDELDSNSNKDRFFAGVPKTPKKDLDGMKIFTLFIQHILYCLSDVGKAAIVVPTGFTTASSGLEKKILKYLIDKKILRGAMSMPANIFANTGTNVSILFIDKEYEGDVVLIDASNLGITVKEDKNQKTILSDADEQRIIETFTENQALEDFSVVVSYEAIAAKNYSLSAGQYFDVKIEYEEITEVQFIEKLQKFSLNFDELIDKGKKLDSEIKIQLSGLDLNEK